MKILVICPTYNSENSIVKIFESFDDSFWSKIEKFLIIDNASTDRTIGIIERNQMKYGKLDLKKNIENIGYGGSIKIGMRYFLDSEYDHLLLLHSDDQTDWNRISHELISNSENLDFQITSRFDVKSNLQGYSRIRVFGNFFFNFCRIDIVSQRIYIYKYRFCSNIQNAVRRSYKRERGSYDFIF